MVQRPKEDLGRQLARSLLGPVLGVRRGESVAIEAWTHSLPWATACVEEAIARGAHPLIMYHDDAAYWRLVDAGHARELGSPGDPEFAALSKSDAYIFFEGPEDRGRYHRLDDGVRRSLEAWGEKWWTTVRKAGTRCAWVLLGRAVPGSARYHGVALGPWRRELIRASLVDPRTMRREGMRIARRLAVGRRLVIRHSNGTDLELRLARRRPIVHDGSIDATDLRAGHVLEEIPSGYVPVAVDERYAEGTIRSNVPSLGMDGHTRLEGARWEFAGGHLTSFTYARGGPFLERTFRAAPAEGRDRPGVLSVGLNPHLERAPVVADQHRGRLMFMIGGNDHHGGANSNPFRAYLLLDGATVDIDGRTVLRGGKIV